MRKFNETLGESMRTVKAEVRLKNDYDDGKNAGLIKVFECLIDDASDFDLVTEYLEKHYELNMDDMWEIVRTYY